MGFVNEFIPEEDVEKYGLEAIDEKFFIGRTSSRHWTIDRKRDIYLRNVARGGGAEPELRSQTVWSFYWHGELIYMRLDSVDGGGEVGGVGWSHWKMVWLNGSNGLPPQLQDKKEQIFADVEEALTAYRSAGAYSREWSGYRVILEIDRDCVI